MNNKIYILLFMLMIQINLFALSNCQIKDEFKDAIINNIVKAVEDQSFTIPSVETYNNKSYLGGIDAAVCWYGCSCNNGTLTISVWHPGYTDEVYNNWRGGFIWTDEHGHASGGDQPSCYKQEGTMTIENKGAGRAGNWPDTWNYPAKWRWGLTNCNRYVSEWYGGGESNNPDVDVHYGCYKNYFVEHLVPAQVCQQGYSGNPCKKTINYNYENMTCDATDTNNQGYGWDLTSLPTSDGIKIDSNINANNTNDLTGDLKSHDSATNLCKRKYQECEIDCVAPLTLDTSSGKCIMDYNTACENKGMIYNETLDICEKINQCETTEAFKDETTDYCAMIPNCNVVNGKCTQEPLKSCNDNTFSFQEDSNLCEKTIGCNNSQIMLDNGKCGSVSYCNNEDTTTINDCINTIGVQKSCSPDDREANLCYKPQLGPDNINIDTFRELTRVDINGSFKELEYGDLKTIYCNNDDGNCTFRLTNIYTQNNGKELCFKDNVGANNCIKIEGSCTMSGSIEFKQGIRQLFIENNNQDIVAYNKAIKDESLGSIHSTCTLSGKVGHLNSSSNHREIIAAKSNGIDIKFWDSYKRGYIGIITFLPTISQVDLDDGYSYKEPEIMQLYRDNFTAFYTTNGNTYAVYNGLIAKTECQSKISGTTFFIPQAENEEEMKILNMLSLLGDNQYNYNNADDNNGSCVIKSSSATSFNSQYYSMKRVSVVNAQTKYVCSPLKCDDHSCQYNQCPTGFIGNILKEEDFVLFKQNNYADLTNEEICLDEICDSKKPYYPDCGNEFGCTSTNGVFQQEDGQCVKVDCEDDEVFDINTNKCKKLGCKNSIERDGKCYKTLEL